MRLDEGVKRRLGRLLLVLASVALLMGGGLAVSELRFLWTGIAVSGKLTDSHGEMDLRTNIPRVTYFVDFQTKAGEKVTFIDQIPGEPLPFEHPQTVYYDPLYPQHARLEPVQRWELPVRILACGFVFCVGLVFVRPPRNKGAVPEAKTLEGSSQKSESV